MVYEVKISPEALAQAEEAYLWILDESASKRVADNWFTDLISAIDSLSFQPARCAYAPEDSHFAEELRQLLHGNGRHRYRIIFTIAKNTVEILHIRHSSMKYFSQT